MGRRRVPENDNDFHLFLNNTSKTLESGSPIGSVRLGLSNNEKIEWLAFRDEWNILYPQYSNLNLRTKTITQEKNALKKKFTAFAARPLGKIALSNNATKSDFAVFRIGVPGHHRQARTEMLSQPPTVDLRIMGSGRVMVRVRAYEGATGRCRKHPGADALEMRYNFLEIEEVFIPPAVSPDSCPFTHIGTVAKFHLDVGHQHLGKRMVAFVRWVSISHPSQNSIWCEVVNTIVA